MDMHGNPGYSVPTYQAPAEADWYHFLHGNVPGHQIDFIFRAEVPQGALKRQHFSHLARLVKYIEPRHGSEYAFAIGNLSRNDTQYEPGHGGIAMIFGLRIKGAVDHAGRQDPPFCHAVACADRQIDPTTMLEAAMRFHEQLLLDTRAPTDGCRWYQSYVTTAQHSSSSVLADMQTYVGAFDRLPRLRPSELGLRWTIEGSNAPQRVVIVYPDDTPFAVLALQMARIASVLVESDIRWTAISTGREQDLPGGTAVRFVPEREAVQEPEDVVLLHIEQMPVEPLDIAQQLFGAHEIRISQTQDLRLKWRHMGEPQQQVAVADPGLARPWTKAAEDADKPAQVEQLTESATGLSRAHVEVEATKKRRRSLLPMVAVGIFVAFLGLAGAGAGWMASREGAEDEPVRKAAAASVEKTVVPVELVAPSQTVEPVVTPSATASASASALQSAVPKATTHAGKPAANVKPKGGLIGGKLRKKGGW